MLITTGKKTPVFRPGIAVYVRLTAKIPMFGASQYFSPKMGDTIPRPCWTHGYHQQGANPTK
jgi:hypothetical protein